MTPPALSALFLEGAAAVWLAVAADALVKSMIVLALAGAAAHALRRAPAAARHLVWLCALGGMLLLPLVAGLQAAGLVSGWTLPGLGRLVPVLPPSPSLTTAPAPPDPIVPAAPAVEPAQPPPPAQQASFPNVVSSDGRLDPPLPAPPKVPPAGALLALWLAGALVVPVQLVAGLRCVRRLVREGERVPNDAPLAVLLRASAARCDVRRPVALFLGPPTPPTVGSPPVPMTWGWLRPTIWLPGDARTWSDERLRVVFLHELAHVRRGDWAAQMFAHAVCALFWFHPLVWLAAAHLRAEAERACDDCVLLSGVPPADYARHLLDIARLLRRPATNIAAATAA